MNYAKGQYFLWHLDRQRSLSHTLSHYITWSGEANISSQHSEVAWGQHVFLTSEELVLACHPLCSNNIDWKKKRTEQRLHQYSQYWTSLQLRLVWGSIFNIPPHSKLAPVQYPECQYGVLKHLLNLNPWYLRKTWNDGSLAKDIIENTNKPSEILIKP